MITDLLWIFHGSIKKSPTSPLYIAKLQAATASFTSCIRKILCVLVSPHTVFFPKSVSLHYLYRAEVLPDGDGRKTGHNTE